MVSDEERLDTLVMIARTHDISLDCLDEVSSNLFNGEFRSWAHQVLETGKCCDDNVQIGFSGKLNCRP